MEIIIKPQQQSQDIDDCGCCSSVAYIGSFSDFFCCVLKFYQIYIFITATTVNSLDANSMLVLLFL